MLGMIIIFLFGWLIYAGLCRLVFGKSSKSEYYIVQEYDVDIVVSRVLEELQELEQEQELELELEQEQEEEVEQIAEHTCELPDNVILFRQKGCRDPWCG